MLLPFLVTISFDFLLVSATSPVFLPNSKIRKLLRTKVARVEINLFRMKFEDVRLQTPGVGGGPLAVWTVVVFDSVRVRMGLDDVRLQSSSPTELFVAERTCVDGGIILHIYGLVVPDLGRNRF